MSNVPPCAGRWELFDSTNYADHLIARTYCQKCPLIEQCQERLEEAAALRLSGVTDGGPRGTWAGQMIGAGSKPKVRPIVTIKVPSDVRRAAHAAYRRGDRTPEVIKGERAYQQAWREKRRAA